MSGFGARPELASPWTLLASVVSGRNRPLANGRRSGGEGEGSDRDRPDDADSAAGLTILVCDDDETVRSLVRAMLSSSGFRVLVASSGQEALSVAAEYGGSIDLLVTDVVMPRMNGFQLAQEMAAARPGVPVLYMSGYPGRATSPGGGQVTHFIAKPFRRAELLRSVREAMNQA